MTRDDRLMAIVLMLRARNRVTARQLARIFNVTERTIYRDMQALMDTDVPIAATPGVEGGYELREGYYIPPIMLNKDEAVALYLGGTFIADRKGTPFRESIRTALEKLEPLLPQTAREPAAITKDHVRWDVSDESPTEQQAGHLRMLTEAIQRQKCVHIRYEIGDRVTERTVSPYGMVYNDGKWYLVGYCHLREDQRMFRVDRITDSGLTLETYETPQDFDLDRYTGNQWAESFQYRLRETARKIEIRTSRDALVEIDKHWLYRYAARRQIAETGEVVVELHDEDEANILTFVRSLGPAVEVISPPDFRARVLADAEALVIRHREKMQDAETNGM